MPKEISHWYLADRVKSLLPEDSVFFDPVHTCENLFFLGAVAPDSPFYYLAGPGSARIRSAAEPFHRPDPGALTPVLSFFEQTQQFGMDTRALSLGAGILCHILADTVFHPLVYYYSGMPRVHPGATARHRQFETALDQYFMHQADRDVRTSLYRILSQTEVAPKTLINYLGKLFALEKPGDFTGLGYAVRSHAFYQALFQNRGVYRILSRLNRGRHRAMEKALSLFYPDDQKKSASFFDTGFQYRDPDSGRECCADIPGLVLKTETRALELLARVSGQMVQNRSLICLAQDDTLPRIRPGMAAGRFWRGKTDLTTDLYRLNK